MTVRLLSAALLICSALAQNVAAQQERQPVVLDPFNKPNAGSIETYGFAGAVLTLKVLGASQALLDRQVLVKLSNEQTSAVLWEMTGEKSQAIFYDVPVGSYDVEATTAGYLPSHQKLNVQRGLTKYQLEITIERDPTSMDVDVTQDLHMPRKLQKRVNRAVAELRSGNLERARKRLEPVYKSASSNGDVNLMLGFIALQQGKPDQAISYLTRATEIDPQNVRALTLLGYLYLKADDYANASKVLTRGVTADDQYWMAHYWLAETYLRQSELNEARKQAELAVATSKGTGLNAQVVLGEALARLGDVEGASQAFGKVLQIAPASGLAKQVRELMAQLEKRDRSDAQNAPIALENAAVSDSVISESEFTAAKWQPPGVDEVKLPTAPDVSCAGEQVIHEAGERVKQFVEDVNKFAAIEEISHEQLDKHGNPTARFKREFNYIASISENHSGVLTVDEDRRQRSDIGEFPGHIATRGLPTLALIFHPTIREDYEMLCEGLGQWQGQATWLVHFRQREDRPKRIKGYQIGTDLYPVALKGRAWISADRYQIVRIESELMQAVPEIQLLTDHEIVEYKEVPFPKKHESLWLPQTAELYFDLKHHHYYRRHSFDHFMLFSVESSDKVAVPGAEGKPGKLQ